MEGAAPEVDEPALALADDVAGGVIGLCLETVAEQNQMCAILT